jgi:hypothetical protein
MLRIEHDLNFRGQSRLGIALQSELPESDLQSATAV